MSAKTAILLGFLFATSHVWAQSNAPVSASTSASTPETAVELQGFTVTGRQPGPALWKVSRGTHVMWVLGTLSPLPKQAQWQTAQVERALGRSRELLEPPSAELKMPHELFARLALMPSARLNPNGASLQRLLPPDMYGRWELLKQRYLANDDALEYWRPIMVAEQLYEKALDTAGLTNDTDIASIVEKLAKKHSTSIIPVPYQLVISKTPTIKDTAEQNMQEGIRCLDQTMSTVEHDMGKLTARANAWATGDTKTLRNLLQGSPYEPCVVAAINGDFAKQLDIPDLPQRIEKAWLKAAEDAIARNDSTFALLSMEQVLAPDGFLAKLKAQGYTVKSPEEQAL